MKLYQMKLYTSLRKVDFILRIFVDKDKMEQLICDQNQLGCRPVSKCCVKKLCTRTFADTILVAL